MTASTLQQQIIGQINQLSSMQQRQVLEFITALQRPTATPGTAIMHLAGAINAEDIAVMKQVADEDCEKVDTDGW